GRAAADAGLGQHARRGPRVHAELVVDRGLPRPRDLHHHAGDQSDGQCAQGLARPSPQGLTRAMRLFLAMVSHETNTFSTIPTDTAQFEARHLHYGGEIIETFRDTGTCLGGMIAVAEQRGATLVPSVAASASPAGRVTGDIYGAVKARMLADL